MRILHIADGDPRQPGIGGSVIRTREINRRLSDRHEITVLTPAYPGACSRVEDGVRWVPIGLRSGARVARLAYLGRLGIEVVRRPHDLLVEDFSAPFSVGFSPMYTRKPVVAVVHWLFASQLRAKYRLPFDTVEHVGLRLYHNFIAVSGWLAEQLRTRRPGATIEAIPNAVEELAFAVEPAEPEHLLFIGRLDIVHKGLDFLLDIVAGASSILGDVMPPVLLAGDGPDRATLEHQVGQRRLSHVVKFLGHVEGREKYQLMTRAYAVLLPSRFETFSIVAAESQAAGAPLVAFDIGPLREVAGGARLIQPFDIDAFTDQVVKLVRHPEQVDQLRHAGRTWARQYNTWDEIAARQEQFCVRAAQRDPVSRGNTAGG